MKYLTLAFWNRIFQQIYRVASASGRGFQEDGCSSKASALTFYTLLSIVPVLAVAFGIAKGFGFEKHLEYEISHKFLEQKEVVDKLITFAYKTLQNTQSGVIAGIGLIVLFWTVLKLFGNIENSFNSIWKVKRARTLARSFSDYLAIILFIPIFFAAASSFSVFMVTYIVSYSREAGLWDTLSPFVYFAFNVFPLILAWLLFTALYTIMPNTRVPLKYAFIAGVCAGTAYQIVQALYIQFQVGLANYGAIYGSFAALPLFLVWLNTSWMIALGGAEIAYHSENDQVYWVLTNAANQRKTDTRVLGCLIMQASIRAFMQGTCPPSAEILAEQTGAPVTVIRHLIQELLLGKLLVEVKWMGEHAEGYLPAQNLDKITIKAVCDALNISRNEFYPLVYSHDVETIDKALNEMDKFLAGSQHNYILSQLLPGAHKEPT